MAMANAPLEVSSLYSAINDFSAALYNELGQDKTKQNFVFSPLSIHLVLFLASVGAKGSTYEEITNALRLPKQGAEMLPLYKEFLFYHEEAEELKLKTGVFIDKSFNVNPNFIEKAQRYLDSTVESLNFANDPAKQIDYLNEWVQNYTDGKINNLFVPGSISQDTKIVLANTIHFSDQWKDPFLTEEMMDMPFYITPAKSISRPMLHKVKRYQYYKDSTYKFSAMRIPYKGNFDMIVLLPDAVDGLSELESNLAKINIIEMSRKMTTHLVTVCLPKFKIEEAFSLLSPLKNMGCPTIFTEKADFTDLAPRTSNSLYVSNVLHKATIDVSENGTEATAATALIMVTKVMTISNPVDKVNFQVDHPFIFAIANKEFVLFMGRVKEF
ncbi:leukocyte elastase inhibitor-like [Daktulosphaira vitifoliae]|uniref:leukocyte elastase inhibitor-like n=1 Tax=Daktulosphaira vitifoliae TaxID=58002 RepID=UPI0021AABCB1|nr:leukocyte elastase inhibitor-like [Daktulosphaira vitifoliae]